MLKCLIYHKMKHTKSDCHSESSEWQIYFSEKIPVRLPFGKTIYQLKNAQSVSTDAAFLVKNVLGENSDSSIKIRALELGSGNGIISIMLSFYRPFWQISGIEIQPELAELSDENAKLSGVKVNFAEGDFRKFSFAEKFDLIVSNPPYFPKNKGLISPHKIRAISRHEIFCTMPELFSVIADNLQAKGLAYVLYPLSRIAEIEKYTKKVDLKIVENFILKSGRKKDKILVKLKF